MDKVQDMLHCTLPFGFTGLNCELVKLLCVQAIQMLQTQFVEIGGIFSARSQVDEIQQGFFGAGDKGRLVGEDLNTFVSCIEVRR